MLFPSLPSIHALTTVISPCRFASTTRSILWTSFISPSLYTSICISQMKQSVALSPPDALDTVHGRLPATTLLPPYKTARIQPNGKYTPLCVGIRSSGRPEREKCTADGWADAVSLFRDSVLEVLLENI